ncbi:MULTISPECIES: hypothetical protein [unclassified Meiothermus]|uniref:hypothetical protein n=1 Tax=unclassified Meiothermus TaxID=370471 RepID=UPI000D7CFAB5|nr:MULTISPECIES: hypothetical protein [unclassified Meiothermus]PZA07756.1 hypothetical protein DNA98_05470 [Meiothermus sp. Pnk-1]RYM38944.1 hypothetical protein EWH23_04225 [Meiothermus sp. PNK-Is4]
MALLMANRHPIARANLSIPRVGRLTARLLLAVEASRAPIRVGDSVSLILADMAFATTCLRVGAAGGWWSVLVVGGAGKLDMDVRPKFYRGVRADVVVRDTLAECREKAGEIDLPTLLPTWSRMGGPARLALSQVLEQFPGRAWRVLPSGEVWVGKENWPGYDRSVDVVEAMPLLRQYQLQLEPSLLPGVRLQGYVAGKLTELGRVERVLHLIGPELRTEVLCA